MTTNTENTMHSEETLRSIEDEITRLEAAVSRLRLLRSRTTYKLEQALREQDRLARDAGITPAHRRKRTPAASDVDSTYDKQERVNFADKFIGILDGMITEGGLSPRDAREVAQAAKVVLDARRSEDVEDAKDGDTKETHSSPGGPGLESINLEEMFARLDREQEALDAEREEGEER